MLYTAREMELLTQSWDEWLAELRARARVDRAGARQHALARLIWREAFLTRPGLIARVQDLLGRDCFGATPRATLRRDLLRVRALLAQAGHRLARSRRGYFVPGRPLLDEHLQKLIAGAVAEVDPRQIAILRTLSPAQRFHQAFSMIASAQQVGVYRLRKRQPGLDHAQATRIVREKMG